MMRTAAVDSALADSISRERLKKYLAESAGDLAAAIGLYEWNCRLSEAFYSSLQVMEICLRNRLSAEMANVFGDDWLQNGRARLDDDAVAYIAAAARSRAPRFGTSGHIIAELNFGFWVGLLGPRL